MSWVLYIWIGYAGSHSTMTYHAEFRTEQGCVDAGKFIKPFDRTRVGFLCIPKEKNT